MHLAPGPRNLITDVPGLRVGQASDAKVKTGVTLVLCDEAYPAAVDVGGGGPGLRETDVLAPENLVGRAHGLVLAGGSVFGLGAADGVAAALSAKGIGLSLRPGAPTIPIVPAAVLHDLGNGGNKAWGLDPPYRRLGITAVKAASLDVALGSVGAGTGAMAGLIKGGIGSTSLILEDGTAIGALAAVNAVGSVFMADGKTFWAWPFEWNNEFGGGTPGPMPPAHDPFPQTGRLDAGGRLRAAANTTLAIVATSAPLTTAECKRLAIMAQDGLARAIRPAHTPFDGDVVFAVATGRTAPPTHDNRPLWLARIGAAAADTLARAIARGVYEATRAPARPKVRAARPSATRASAGKPKRR
jgi:L-aminopeptidase/D-esterase-like protein